MAEPGFIEVRYRKYDGSLHWNLRMLRLGEDEHGVWLGLPRDSRMRKGEGPWVPIPQAHVILIPSAPDTWFTACFNGEPEQTAVYCDITTPADWPHPGEVTMVDLDLDVLLQRSQPAAILVDEDEFAEHQVRYGYPGDVVRNAELAAQVLLEAVSDGTGPFGGAHLPWLALVER